MDEKKYFVGTREDSPFQNITIGGVSFPRYTEIVKASEGGNETIRNQQKGAIIVLTDDQVEKVKKAALNKIVRTNMSKKHPYLVDKDEKYKSRQDDVPVGKFIYMISIEEAAAKNPMWQNQEQPALVSTITIKDEVPLKPKKEKVSVK